jgi:hypothetical protein
MCHPLHSAVVLFNGMITNDKFCMIRQGQVKLRWSRRPSRFRPRKSDYAPDDRRHGESRHETARADTAAMAPDSGRGTAVGPGLSIPAGWDCPARAPRRFHPPTMTQPTDGGPLGEQPSRPAYRPSVRHGHKPLHSRWSAALRPSRPKGRACAPRLFSVPMGLGAPRSIGRGWIAGGLGSKRPPWPGACSPGQIGWPGTMSIQWSSGKSAPRLVARSSFGTSLWGRPRRPSSCGTSGGP